MIRTVSQEGPMGTHKEDAKGTKLFDYYGATSQETACTSEACAGIQQLLFAELLSAIVQLHAT